MQTSGDREGPSTCTATRISGSQTSLQCPSSAQCCSALDKSTARSQILLSFSFTYYFLAESSKYCKSDYSTQAASCSPLKAHHCLRYQPQPGTKTYFARNERRILERLYGLASWSAGFVDSGEELGYTKKWRSLHLKRFLLLYQNFFSFSNVCNLFLLH